MNAQSDDATILFADISKSTRLYEVLGDSRAQEIVNRCLLILSAICCQYFGKVVKTIGDEVMCIFDKAEDAAQAARAMHQAMERQQFSSKPTRQNLNIHIGLHTGPVVQTGDDVFGDTVNTAARMLSLAKARHILTTSATVRALSPRLREMVRKIDVTTIHGKSGETTIYEICWDLDEITIVAEDTLTSKEDPPARLEMRFQGQKIEVGIACPAIGIGRQAGNDLMVDDSRVSRFHARIEYRRGRFVLIDQSTNGTYLHVPGKPGKRYRNQEVLLQGKGLIGLGRKVNPDSDLAIRFALRS